MSENNEIYGIIYLIKNNINGKVYIGQTTQKFDERYKGDLEKYTHNSHLKNSIKKYGIENFYINKEFDIAYSQEELDELEKKYIKQYNTNNPNYGYNKTEGGSNGKMSEETKKKMSKSHKGKKLSEEHKKHLSKARKGKYCGEYSPMYGRTGELSSWWGKHHTYETKKKISEANKGKILSKETKNKISEANKNRIISEETKQKISEANSGENHPMYGKHHTNETKQKMSENRKGKCCGEKNGMYGTKSNHRKKVICVTTNIIFDCIKDAGEFYNIKHVEDIVKVCQHKRKSCGKLEDGTKLHWMYYDEYLTINNTGEGGEMNE